MINFKQYISAGLVGLALILLTGCFPEDSIEWSDDGSLGIARINGEIALVDGKNGSLTPIEKGNDKYNSSDISADGELIAYSQTVEFESLEEALRQLPRHQVNLIAHYAQRIRDQIERWGWGNENLDDSFLEDSPFSEDKMKIWLSRHLWEKSNREFLDKIPPDKIKNNEKKKNKKLILYQLCVQTTDNTSMNQKTVVTSSILPLWWLKISPDKKHIAYLQHNGLSNDDNPFQSDLYLAGLTEDIKTMRVAQNVAFGYAWRPDSRALAYLENKFSMEDKEMSFGSLNSVEIADEKGKILASPLPDDLAQKGSIASHHCRGKYSHLAATLFHVFMKAQYNPQGRILFAGANIDLPMSSIEEVQWSIFSFDPATKAITDILPHTVSRQLDEWIGFFDLSPDGTKLLLPLKKHRCLVYTLGNSSDLTPIPESESFGERAGDMAPSWMGNDEFSCYVSSKSRFLKDYPHRKEGQNEVIVLGSDGKLRRVLSQSW